MQFLICTSSSFFASFRNVSSALTSYYHRKIDRTRSQQMKTLLTITASAAEAALVDDSSKDATRMISLVIKQSTLLEDSPPVEATASSCLASSPVQTRQQQPIYIDLFNEFLPLRFLPPVSKNTRLLLLLR